MGFCEVGGGRDDHQKWPTIHMLVRFVAWHKISLSREVDRNTSPAHIAVLTYMPALEEHIDQVFQNVFINQRDHEL